VDTGKNFIRMGYGLIVICTNEAIEIHLAIRANRVIISSFIFIPWIRTGLQNPYGYGNSQICLRNLEVK